jgi:hypothetical protein
MVSECKEGEMMNKERLFGFSIGNNIIVDIQWNIFFGIIHGKNPGNYFKNNNDALADLYAGDVGSPNRIE